MSKASRRSIIIKIDKSSPLPEEEGVQGQDCTTIKKANPGAESGAYVIGVPGYFSNGTAWYSSKLLPTRFT